MNRFLVLPAIVLLFCSMQKLSAQSPAPVGAVVGGIPRLTISESAARASLGEYFTDGTVIETCSIVEIGSNTYYLMGDGSASGNSRRIAVPLRENQKHQLLIDASTTLHKCLGAPSGACSFTISGASISGCSCQDNATAEISPTCNHEISITVSE